MRPPRALPVFAALVAAALLAGTAAAEPVRLRSGATLEATSVTLKGDAFVLRLEIGAGTGTMRLPLAQVEPADLVRLLRTRIADSDAAGQVRVAHAALEARLYGEAIERVTRAALLDPAFGAEQTRVVAAVRSAEASDAITEAELDLRTGRAGAARARLKTLLESGVPVVPPELEAARARLLLALVEKALAAPKPVAPPAMPPLPGGPAEGAPGAGVVAALTDADALETRARAGRERAADPSLTWNRRESLLSAAAVDLLNARRTLLALPADAAPDLLVRLEVLRGLLVATWLDMADLARTAGHWTIALDRVQAALVLEPESERAWELRRWLDQDLRGPFLLPQGPPLVLEYSFSSFGSLAPFGRSYGYGHGYGYGGARFGACFGPHACGYRPSGGTTHYRGTRR